MKKIISLLLILLLTLSLVPASAEEAPQVSVLLNGYYIDFDVAPVIEEGRTLVPIRAISEAMGYGVEWDSVNRKVTLRDGDESLVLYIDDVRYQKNGAEKTMDVPARIKEGRTLVPLRLIAEEFGCTVEWDAEWYEVNITKCKVVEAENAIELLNAVNSYTTILLTGEEYNLSEVDPAYIYNPYVTVSETFDGTEFWINYVDHLTIKSASDAMAEILIEPRYSNVLNFSLCFNLTIQDIIAGHTIEQGSCTGGVLNFEYCADIDVEGCRLYGCGTYGIQASYTDYVNVTNTEIYECSYGLVSLNVCNGVKFDLCLLRSSGEFSMFELSEAYNVEVRDSIIRDNRSGEWWPFISAGENGSVAFINCEFINNSYEMLYEGAVYFEDCIVE